MKTTKLLILILFTIFLTSCKGFQIKPLPTVHLSLHFKKCSVECYDPMKMESVKDSKCNIKKPKKDQIDDHRPIYSLEVNADGDYYLKFHKGVYHIDVCDGTQGVLIEDFAVKLKPGVNKKIQEAKDARKRKK